jgi:oligosaccharide repeat unit polymerase
LFGALTESDLTIALLIDISTLVACIVLLLRYGRLSHSHPGTIYLFFHLYTFTFRLIGLVLGADTLFSGFEGFMEPVSQHEITRAALLGDLVLLLMTAAWIKASRDDLTKMRRTEMRPTNEPNLSVRYIWIVVSVAFPLGILGLLTFANVPGFSALKDALLQSEWQTSNYFFIMQVWAGLALLALIYWYGFRWWLLLPMTGYLLIMSYQGYHRFRVIIPALLLIQIFVDRRKLKWPPAYLSTVLVAVLLIYFPLKSIGQMAQEGESIRDIVDTSTESVNMALMVKAPDQQFLDQFACALSLVDDEGHYYYGSTYLALVTLPVPRQWWPEKPGLADYLYEISKPWRPMGELGMIVTFLGESYINFGYAGIVIIPILLAYVLARIYFRAYRSNYFTVARLCYLLIACNLIQVYRDGLTSVIVFTWVNMMPLMVIVALHYIVPTSKRRKIEAVHALG